MLNITLPDRAIDFIEKQAIANGFSMPSEYVLHLILREQERLATKEHVESLLIQGLDSGSAIEVTDDWWSQLKEGAIVRAERDLFLVQE
jgi:antitoxin ParD1/3/4